MSVGEHAGERARCAPTVHERRMEAACASSRRSFTHAMKHRMSRSLRPPRSSLVHATRMIDRHPKRGTRSTRQSFVPAMNERHPSGCAGSKCHLITPAPKERQRLPTSRSQTIWTVGLIVWWWCEGRHPRMNVRGLRVQGLAWAPTAIMGVPTWHRFAVGRGWMFIGRASSRRRWTASPGSRACAACLVRRARSSRFARGCRARRGWPMADRVRACAGAHGGRRGVRDRGTGQD
jgi:hypothetical protein